MIGQHVGQVWRKTIQFLNCFLLELASIGNMIEGAAYFSLSASLNITLLTHTDREIAKVKEEKSNERK